MRVVQLLCIGFIATVVGSPRADADGSYRNPIAGPVLAWLTTADHRSVYPIHGIPGAAWIGASFELPYEVLRTAVSNRRNFLLAVTPDQTVVAIDLATGSERPVARLEAPVDALEISSSGSAAVVYSREPARIVVITGLMERQPLARELDGSLLPGPVSAMAVGDDGAVVASVRSGNAGQLFFISSKREVRLFETKGVPAMSFVPHGRALLVAADSNLYRFPDLSTGTTPVLLAQENIGGAAPAAMAVTRDQRRAFFAHPETRTVAIRDIDTGETATLTCPCSPQVLRELNADSVFLLTETAPYWMLDAGGREPRLVAIPAAERPAER
jgi:hypothetical protein